MKNLMILTTALFSLLSLMACSSDDDLEITSEKNIELTRENTSQIKCSDPKATFISENEYVAIVSDKGLIEAQRIGETRIKINGKNMINVTVKPVYTQYKEPLLTFGATKNEIISKAGNNYKTPNATSLVYKFSNGPVIAHAYIFENGKCTGSGMLVSTYYTETLTEFLLERYLPATLDYDNYLAVFINALTLAKTTMLIGEQIQSAYDIIVYYMPYDNAKGTSRSENEEKIRLDTLSKKIDQALLNQ
ncbi:MAG: hypothetical protein PHR45_00900 [Muribaculaceae bacterium]|nr:hypothetical protein [Muribaculaceae bacterium]